MGVYDFERERAAVARRAGRLALLAAFALALGLGDRAAAASVGGPTVVDASGGAGTTAGGEGGLILAFANKLQVGQTRVKGTKPPKAPRNAELVIGDADWDDVDGGPADRDTDPDTIRVRGDVVVAGTLRVDGDENLSSEDGDVFVEGGIVRTGDPGEDDGAPGLEDDDSDSRFNLDALDGAVVVRGVVDVAGDAGSDGAHLDIVAPEIFVAAGATLSASGGDAGPGEGDGGRAGNLVLHAARDAKGKNMEEIGEERRYLISVEPGSSIEARGGSSADEDGGDTRTVFIHAFSPVKRTKTALLGRIDVGGGDGATSGGAAGTIDASGTDLALSGMIDLTGGAASAGDGGSGGALAVNDTLADRIRFGGGDEPEDVSFFASGGDATSGPGGKAGRVGQTGVLRCKSYADVVARGGAGTVGGGGGAASFVGALSVSNAGAVDVSGGGGASGAGGDAGASFGFDPDETMDPNFVAIVFSTLDGSLTNTGALVARGGSGMGGDGGAGGDVLFLIDDTDARGEAGKPDMPVVASSDDVGGRIVNSGDVEVTGGDALGAGQGGDAGDVSFDADPDDDEVSGKKARRSSNTGAIAATGGDATMADAAGGDGGDVLFRTAEDFTNAGAVSQAGGADAGSPAEPAEDGVTTQD